MHHKFTIDLTNTPQFHNRNNNKSEGKFITHWASQGYVLGPLCFIVFMNDLTMSSKHLFSIICILADINQCFN